MKIFLIIVLLIIGGLLVVPKFSVNAQVGCPTGSQVEGGLISATEITGAFGNITGNCIKSNEAQFAFFKIPTYDQLLNQFFTKAKISSDTTTITGDATEANLNFDTTPLIHVTGNLTLGADATANPPATATGPGVVFVDGNLNIMQDYTYGKTSPNDSYGTVFVVRGDTIIETIVKEVNAVIIGQGTIYTASNLDTGGRCNTSTVPTSRQLVINGSLISINDPYKDPLNPTPNTTGIKFCRVLVPNPNSAKPSEIITLQSKYLSILRNIFSTSIQKWAEIPDISITAVATTPTEPEPDPEPIILPKRVFVTSNTYTGNLGGIAGGDRKCQVAAFNSSTYPDLKNSAWKAWLSTSTVSADSRFNYSSNFDFRLVDNTLVANNWAGLLSGSLNNQINKDQNGNTITNSGVWTNTTSSGGITSTDTGYSCSNWTSALDTLRGGYGSTGQIAGSWTQAGSASCSTSVFRLYCFEDGYASPPPQNLLTNGNFENQMANWSCQGDATGGCTVGSTAGGMGTYSMQITNSGGGTWGKQISQNPNVTAATNEQFCLSAYVKKENSSADVRLAMQVTSEPYNRAVEILTAVNTNWQLVQQTITKPANWTPTIQVYIRNNSVGSVWVDDVILTRGTCEERY